jgi:hypothetical protein
MSSLSYPQYPQQRTNPLIYVGTYSAILIALLVITIVIIAYVKPCGNVTGEITKRECCKKTWERFDSSVPLTVFIVSIVTLVLALIFVYFGRSKTA